MKSKPITAFGIDADVLVPPRRFSDVLKEKEGNGQMNNTPLYSIRSSQCQKRLLRTI